MTEETNRKLASIQVIENLSPIEGADAIECAKVLGWHVVVKKGEFKVGDKVIYCEVDSVLPERPEFEFMRPRKFRVKTIRLRGQVSQGLCFPLSILLWEHSHLKVGDDITNEMGIVKYEIPIPAHLQGKIIGSFPSFLPKTDETRVQVLEDVLKRHKGAMCYVSEKLDGTSCTYFVKDGVFGVCSRNLHLADTEDNTHWQLAKKYKIEEKLKSLGKNVAIQGEIVGLGVQKNTLRLREKRFYAFQLFDIDNYEYFDCYDFIDTCKKLEIETVPILDIEFVLHDDIDKLVQYSIGKSKICPEEYREGVVIRTLEEKLDMQMTKNFGNGRISFKVINPEYLLKHGD